VDYGGIRTMAWIALGCAVLVVMVMLFNKSGISTALDTPSSVVQSTSPMLDENYGVAGQRIVMDTMTFDLWKWGGVLALMSLLLCGWHLLRGTTVTRLLLLICLVGWIGWTLSAIVFSLDGSSKLIPDFSPYQFYGGKTLAQQSQTGSGAGFRWLGYAVAGLIGATIVGVVLRSEVQERDFLESQQYPEPQWENRLAWREFRTLRFLVLLFYISLPTLLSVFFASWIEALGLLAYVPILFVGAILNPIPALGRVLLFGLWVIFSVWTCLAQLRYCSSARRMLIFFNEMVAILLVWILCFFLAKFPDQNLNLLLATPVIVAIFGGVLLCVPVRHVGSRGVSPRRTTNSAQLATGELFAASSAGFCGNCGQPVHARNGQCLNCGAAVQPI